MYVSRIEYCILTEAMPLLTLKNEAALRPRIYSVDNNSWGRNVSVRPNVFSREIFRPTKNEGKYVSKHGTSCITYWYTEYLHSGNVEQVTTAVASLDLRALSTVLKYVV